MKGSGFLSVSLLLLIFFSGCITIQTAPPVTTTPSGGLPVIIEFGCAPSTIDPGNSSILSWNVTGADSVSIDQGIGTVDAAGTKAVSPAASTVYTISATNFAGTVISSSSVTVNAALQTSLPQITGGQKTVILPALSEESGSIISSTSLSTGIPTYSIDKDNICIGDKSGGAQIKAFLSFDISAIPRNAVIEEAILDISDCTKSGNPTYGTLYSGMGAVKVYHHQYGDIADPTRISMIWSNRLAKLTQNGSFTKYPLSPWSWDVKNSEEGDPVIQGLVQTEQTRSQFMLEFFTSTNWDYVSDTLCFSNPALTIKYTLP